LPPVKKRSNHEAAIPYNHHPENRWLNWPLGVVTAVIVLLSLLGALSAFGVLPSTG